MVTKNSTAHLYKKDPKRIPNLENYPYRGVLKPENLHIKLYKAKSLRPSVGVWFRGLGVKVLGFQVRV